MNTGTGTSAYKDCRFCFQLSQVLRQIYLGFAMVEAVKGSVKQYLLGLKDSFYGFTHIFHLNKKIAEQNRKKRQRMQDDFQLRLVILLFPRNDFIILDFFRRHRSRFEARRRPLHSSNPTSSPRPALPTKTEYGLLECLCRNTSMNILIWIAIWGFYEYLVPWLKLLMEVCTFHVPVFIYWFNCSQHYSYCIVSMFGLVQRIMLSSSSNGEEMEMTRKQWAIVEKLLQYIFSSLWVLPLYFISKVSTEADMIWLLLTQIWWSKIFWNLITHHEIGVMYFWTYWYVFRL